MFTQTWNKYLPVIRILMKRAVNEEQMIKLNTFDFQKAATVRKAGYKFTIGFTNGKPDNIIGMPDIAKDFSSVLMADATVKELFAQNAYVISFDTKYQLTIKKVAVPVSEPAIPEFEAAAE